MQTEDEQADKTDRRASFSFSFYGGPGLPGRDRHQRGRRAAEIKARKSYNERFGRGRGRFRNLFRRYTATVRLVAERPAHQEAGTGVAI